MKEAKSSRFPNVIIAGAPKCGTSSLFFWLAAHPEVCASKVKETYFLSDTVNRHNEGLNYLENGLDAYQEHFSHCENHKVRLEATPVYIYHKLPLEILPKLAEMPKVIFILRNPANQVYSHYRFNKYRMKNISMPFKDYVNYETHGPKGWSNYMERAEYVNYLKSWVDTIGKEKILLIQFEALLNNKVEVMKQISDFIGVDSEFYDTFGFLKRNESLAVGSKWLHRKGLKFQKYIPLALQEKLLPWYQKLNLDPIPKTTEEELQVIEQLKVRYQPSVAALAELFDEFDPKIWQ